MSGLSDCKGFAISLSGAVSPPVLGAAYAAAYVPLRDERSGSVPVVVL